MNILLLYGGRSCEHDISIVTAKITEQAIKTIGKVYSVYCDSDNVWWHIKKSVSPQEIKKKHKSIGEKVFLTTGDSTLKTIDVFGRIKKLDKIHIAVPCFHGVNGEDGSISGLLQLSNIPTTCGNTFACGASMDKIATKTVLKGIGARVLPAVIFKTLDDQTAIKAINKLGFPLVTKPVNLGSSIGIEIVHSFDELKEALKKAFKFDDRVIVEKALTNFYEVNCSAMRINDRVEVSKIERPIPKDKILTFADKYISGAKEQTSRIFPYHFEMESTVQLWTKKIYNAFNFDGVVRVDFLVNATTNEVFTNEVNAIPGSLAYYLWQDRFEHTQMLQNLINQAIEKHNKKQSLCYFFESDILFGGSKGNLCYPKNSVYSNTNCTKKP